MIDYREALRARDVVPNSTWMKKDNTEMYIVLPDDDDAVRLLMKDYAVESVFSNDPDCKPADGPGWIRIARIRLDNKQGANVDVVFIPAFLGHIDKGTYTRIG